MKPDVPALKRFVNKPAPGWMAVSRGAAMGLALLLALNLAEVFVYSTSAANNWLANLSVLSQNMGIAVLAMAATSFIMFAFRPELPGPVWFAATACIITFIGFSGRELWVASAIEAAADRTTAMIRPLGILMLLSVSGIGILAGNSDSVRGYSSWTAIFISSLLAVFGFAIVTVQSGGRSDSMEVDSVPVAVVLGCPLDAQQKPTEELTDRVHTGSKIVSEKKAKRLIVSATSETETMQTLAEAAGVPNEQIVIHSQSVNVAASMKFAANRPDVIADKRIIVVSHWFELARVRMLARRRGLTVFAVAAEQKHALFNQNLRVLRETGLLLATMCEPAVSLIRNRAETAPAPEKEASSP